MVVENLHLSRPAVASIVWVRILTSWHCRYRLMLRRESSSLLLMHSLVLLVEERMSQVASRALERETHFCPGLAVEPVSHRRKNRNSCDFSFRFHECWSSEAAASDGSNSVSIFGAGWTRTKYSRPISSCRIGSGNISASRAYCERCAAIAAIFCWI